MVLALFVVCVWPYLSGCLAGAGGQLLQGPDLVRVAAVLRRVRVGPGCVTPYIVAAAAVATSG